LEQRGVYRGVFCGRDHIVRAFHTAVLGDGSLSLDILDAKIDRWIASRQREIQRAR
jgi:hypothetical protein